MLWGTYQELHVEIWGSASVQILDALLVPCPAFYTPLRFEGAKPPPRGRPSPRARTGTRLRRTLRIAGQRVLCTSRGSRMNRACAERQREI